MMFRYFILFWILFQSTAIAQPSPKEYAELITPADLKDNLGILASDALEGRETGTRGQKMAAAFIRFHFEKLGLKAPADGDYYQHFDLYKNVQGEVYLSTRGTTFRNFEDVFYYGKDNSGGEISLPIVYAGKGRLEDYDQLQVEGKAVLIHIGEEQDYRGPVSLARSRNAKIVFVLNTRTQDQFREYARQFEAFLSDERLSLKKPEAPNRATGIFFVSPTVAEKIFNTTVAKLTEASGDASRKAVLKKVLPGNVAFKTTVDVQTVETENVLGYLEGTDKKEELLIITSHYDHIGRKKGGAGDLINNGADDDGSGTVAVMQLAKAFAQASKDGKGPRRSVLFMTVAGEENGLLGSEYYTQYPIYPLANTVVNLNIDMIGRRDEQHEDSPPYVYVIGADKLSSELHKLSEAVNSQHTNLLFDYTYNDENHPARLYYRSDHWNFAQKNIPIIFYFDGIHEDYHQPSDEVDKIEFDLLTVRTKCIFYTAWEIANREQRIVPDVKK
jgi:hypothetical protein